MATHAAIRGAGRVCECVRMYRECGFTGGVFNRGAETDGTHSLRHDGLTHLKSSSSNLSLPLDQIFSVLSLFFFFFLSPCVTIASRTQCLSAFSQHTGPHDCRLYINSSFTPREQHNQIAGLTHSTQNILKPPFPTQK